MPRYRTVPHRTAAHGSATNHSLAAWKAFHSHAPFNCNQLIHYYSYSAFKTCHFALLHVEVVFIIGSTLLHSQVEQAAGRPRVRAEGAGAASFGLRVGVAAGLPLPFTGGARLKGAKAMQTCRQVFAQATCHRFAGLSIYFSLSLSLLSFVFLFVEVSGGTFRADSQKITTGGNLSTST